MSYSVGPPGYGHPDYWQSATRAAEVSALAGRLSRIAAAIDDSRARLGAATTLDWRSKAAEAFRQEAGQRVAALAGCAADVRAAAACVSAYGRALESLASSGPGTGFFGG